MASLIQNLLHNALGDGARAAKFECGIYFPHSKLFPDMEVLNTLVKTSSFPGKSHEILDVKYKGRSIPVKGQMKYNQSWECTFYLSEDHSLKNAFEVWMEALDQKHNYSQDNDMFRDTIINHSNFEKYTSEIFIQQLNFDLDKPTAIYSLHNVFPISISQVDTNYESVGQIQEFTVTFSYSHYDIHIPQKEQGSFAEQLVSNVINLAKDAIGLDSGFISSKVESFLGSTISDINKETQDSLNKMYGVGLTK